MKKAGSIAMLVYGDPDSNRNAVTEEKYRDLAAAFMAQNFDVKSVLFNEEMTEKLLNELPGFNAVLVWVNPIEQGKDRKKLDTLLLEISNRGCFVSAHPDIILKIGTKDVLYKTKDMDWGSDVKLYNDYRDFEKRFPKSLRKSGIRILKQYRGNGGNGIFKIILTKNDISILPAKTGSDVKNLSWEDFNDEFKSFFLNDGILIDQEWNTNMQNGMVRCYLSGNQVAGFGYQEINLLYESKNGVPVRPSKRYYFTESCGLFSDLKEIMETKWVPQLQSHLSIETSLLPVIWDADFFINDPHRKNVDGKYTLCEINVSSVSPFPPSAIPFIIEAVKQKIL